MECLNCEEKTAVIESIKFAGTVYRRRRCTSCNYIFWTEELEIIDMQGVREALAFKKDNYRTKKSRVTKIEIGE